MLISKTFPHPFAGLSDEELLPQALAGDELAFGLLYDRCEGGVYQFALRMTGSAEMAEDVTQDVFMALLRRGQLFDPARGTLMGYLLGMTRNRVLTLLQREKTYLPLQADEGEEETTLAGRLAALDDPLLKLTRTERIEAVRHAILALPLHYREVVVLCNLDEMSYEQAAAVLDCPIGTVRSRLNRARGLLLDRLAILQSRASGQLCEAV